MVSLFPFFALRTIAFLFAACFEYKNHNINLLFKPIYKPIESRF